MKALRSTRTRTSSAGGVWTPCTDQNGNMHGGSITEAYVGLHTPLAKSRGGARLDTESKKESSKKEDVMIALLEQTRQPALHRQKVSGCFPNKKGP